MEKIICSAIKLETGEIFYGHRHNHCFDAINGKLSWTMNRQEIDKISKEQGFVTTEGRFVDRREGWIIAKLANQIIQISGSEGSLYSEDIY